MPSGHGLVRTPKGLQQLHRSNFSRVHPTVSWLGAILSDVLRPFPDMSLTSGSVFVFVEWLPPDKVCPYIWTYTVSGRLRVLGFPINLINSLRESSSAPFGVNSHLQPETTVKSVHRMCRSHCLHELKS